MVIMVIIVFSILNCQSHTSKFFRRFHHSQSHISQVSDSVTNIISCDANKRWFNGELKTSSDGPWKEM